MQELFNGILNLIGFIIYVPLGYILAFCYQIGKDYGVAIILFTIITRVCLFPLALKQQRSTAQMARLRPKMDKIQKKYAKDRVKQSEAMQKLYAEEGYSPYGGCLPMLIQLPILYGLFGVIYRPLTYILHLTQAVVKPLEAAMKPFMSTAHQKDTSKLEIYTAQAANQHSAVAAHAVAGHFSGTLPTINFDFLHIKNFDLSATPTFTFSLLVLIPIVCYLSSLASAWFTMKTAATANMPGQKTTNRTMIFIMPIMSTVFSVMVPAGVGFYWIVSNLLMIVQSLIILKFYHPQKLIDKLEAESEVKREDRRKKIAAARGETYVPYNDSDDDDDEEVAAPTTTTNQAPRAINQGQPRPPQHKGKKRTKKQMQDENRRRLAESRKREQANRADNN